jgi:hypothetical protein
VSAVRVREAEPVSAPELSLVPTARRLPSPKLVLAGIYVVAVLYHWLQSRAHVTPAVFGDELLYSKLAQSIASGHGFVLRGEAVQFPAPLAILAQAPAWLIDSTPTAFAVVKALNVAVMSAAVFPAYCLARRVARPSNALLAAAAAVAGPAMLYGPYLMSEALAYPVFLLALATMVRAIDSPSLRMELAVVAVSLAAVLTRIQLVVLPIAYLVAVARVRGLRRHAVSLGVLGGFGAVPVVTGGAVLGTYLGATTLHFEPGAVLRWSGFTAALLPFVAGWLVVPGALLGLALLVLRPKGRADAAVGTLVVASVALVLLEVGLIAAGEAGRSVERYAIYLLPLAAIAFFAYVERGAPWRPLYAGLALAGGGTAWLLDFPARAGEGFTFDTLTFSVYGQTALWLGHANAATIFAGVPLFGGIALALLSLRRPHVAAGVGTATLALLLLSGIPAYAGDHAMTRGTLELRAGDPPDWLDRSGLGPADYLQLPGGSGHYGWILETWNRSVRRPIQLGLASADGYASHTGRIDREGRFLVDGRAPPAAGALVVNDFATAIDFEGARVVARPRDGLTAYRLPSRPRVRSLANGIFFDRWAAAVVGFQAWPDSGSGQGFYRVVLSLPTRFGARQITLETGGVRREMSLEGGQTRVVRLPVRGYPLPLLNVRTDRADYVGAGTSNARLVAVRIPSISYVTKRRTDHSRTSRGVPIARLRD